MFDITRYKTNNTCLVTQTSASTYKQSIKALERLTRELCWAVETLWLCLNTSSSPLEAQELAESKSRAKAYCSLIIKRICDIQYNMT